MANSQSILWSLVSRTVAVVCLNATIAPAAVLYSTDFDGPAGTTPTDWTASSVTLSGTGEYGPSTGTALSVYTGLNFSSGTIESDFQLGGHTGVVARYQSSTNYYLARLYGTNLEIYRWGLGGGQAELMGQVAAPGYVAGQTWNISTTLLGPSVTATLRDQNSDIVQSLTVFNNNNRAVGATSRAGVRGSTGSIWENFTVTDTIPSTLTITTADGVGADAYVQDLNGGNRGTNYGAEANLQLKNAGPQQAEGTYQGRYLSRKTYLRFDLDAIGALDTEIAWLELTGESGTGSAWEFDVYGLLDGHGGESWTETGTGSITWNNAPGNDTEDLDGVLGDDTVYLGQFTTGGYAAGDVLQFGSLELLDFLNADTDGQVTLILTRFTHNDSYDSHSNSFYSHEGSFTAMGDYSLAPRLMVYAVPEPSTLMLSLLGLFPLVLCLRPRKW